MRILDLGPLRVESAGVTRPLGGRRLEAVLCALLIRPSQVVSTDVLTDAVWGDDAPPRSAAALDTLVWRLRRLLEPDRTPRAPSTILCTEEHGYRLTIPPDDVDSWSFVCIAERLSSDTASATERLAQTAGALELWRGRPYDTVPETDQLLAVQARLQEQRLLVQRFHIDALLAVGQPERAVAESIPMLAEDPYAEPLWVSRIRGLRRAGRPAAAAAAYRECVELFRRELGTPAGPEIRAALESGDADGQGAPASVRASPTSGEFLVPRRRSPLVGRLDELAAVGELLRRRHQACLVGPVGCGKTRLAIAVAGALRDEHPGGVFFVDLAGVADGAAVPDRVQEVLHLPGDRLRGAEAVVCAFLAGRTVLLVLDNCEQVADAAAKLVETVLATCPLVTILVTSRQPLGIEGEAVFLLRPLAVPAGPAIAELAASSAAVLLAERLADRGGYVASSGPEREAIAQICAATDGLPLSLELAAALSPVLTLYEIAAHVTANPTGLRSPGRSLRESRGEASLHDSIERSHRLLTGSERIAHRRLAVLPPEFSLDAAVAVCADHQLAADIVTPSLAGLTYRSLLDAVGPSRAGGPSRFRQLVPMRWHATRQLGVVGEVDAVTERRNGWVRRLVRSGPRHGLAGQSAYYQRLADNHQSVVVALDEAIAAGPTDDDVFTIGRLLPYWVDRMIAPYPLRVTTALAAAVTPSNSVVSRLVAVILRGAVLAVNQQASVGHDTLTNAVAELRALGVDTADRARSLQIADLLITAASCCWVGDDYELATVISQLAGAYGDALDDSHVRLCAEMFECLLLLWQDAERAAARAETLFAHSTRIGNDFAALLASVTCSIAALFAGDGLAGLRWTAESLALQHRLGVRSISDTLETRGNHYVAAGQPVEAVRCYAAAHLNQTRLGRDWPHHPATAERLASARSSLPSGEFDSAWAGGERLAAENLIEGWL